MEASTATATYTAPTQPSWRTAVTQWRASLDCEATNCAQIRQQGFVGQDGAESQVMAEHDDEAIPSSDRDQPLTQYFNNTAHPQTQHLHLDHPEIRSPMGPSLPERIETEDEIWEDEETQTEPDVEVEMEGGQGSSGRLCLPESKEQLAQRLEEEMGRDEEAQTQPTNANEELFIGTSLGQYSSLLSSCSQHGLIGLAVPPEQVEDEMDEGEETETETEAETQPQHELVIGSLSSSRQLVRESSTRNSLFSAYSQLSEEGGGENRLLPYAKPGEAERLKDTMMNIVEEEEVMIQVLFRSTENLG
ncbi:hypothetical protein V5O48_016862 [Marasmius crinis-equi]|uniref:Uncharacterized protein n=1 Tax=Marasmius crinis-equi TaxID=585013 RepID=A0ABR3EQT4_9AGAR